MCRHRFIIILIAALMLSACAPVATAVSTPLPTAIPATPTITIVPTITSTPTQSPTTAPTTAITPSGPATCQVTSVVPTPDPTAEAILPAVSGTDWVKGVETASITIIEYADFQDKASAQLSDVLQQILEKYPDEVRLVYRYFPLTEQYDKTLLAAQAAEAAGMQGKFWQFHDLLFASQSEWTSKSSDEFTAWAYEKAAELGLNADQFKQDMLSDTVIAKINSSRSEAKYLNVENITSDPFVFFNGSPIEAPYGLDIFVNIIAYLNLPERAFSTCPPMTIDPNKSYTATIQTEKGNIVIELYANKTPWAVNSFVFLAQNGWYNNSGFFRVIPGFMAQAGDPSNSGLGTPGYSFSDELTPDLRFNKSGVVALANSGRPNTNGSQFFITYAAVPSLDGNYTIFGQVISGMDVFTSLRPRDPDNDVFLFPPDTILSVTIEVK